MVNIHVNDNNNQIRINVPGINNTVTTESTNPNNNVSSTIGNETFYNGLAKEWAISPNLVQGIDYSSKYYAGQSANSASEAASAVEGFEDTVIEATQQALGTLDTTKQTIIGELADEETDIISDLNTEKAIIISDIQEEGTTQVNAVTNTGTSYVSEMTTLKDATQGYADSASDSASSASASETNASNSASDASGYANSAALSATSANNSALSAAASESNANTYASNANTSANNASTSETNAAASESNAQTYANNASASASSASTSASNAATSETNAGNSATAAVTSEDNAEIWAEGTDAQVQALGGVHSAKGWAEESATGQINSNWAENDPTSKAYIFNKPTKLSDFTNDSGFTSNVGTVTSVNNTQPDANGNVTLTIPDTATWGNITGTLSNQTDLQTALDSKITNTATGFGSLTICGNAGTYPHSTNIGISTAVGEAATAIGYGAGATQGSIQLGYGANNTNMTFKVGFNYNDNINNWTMLNGYTGKIPSDRISFDNKTISKNYITELQVIGTIDQNNTSNAIKTWTGTKAQYDAIVTKDSNTLYNITDDTDVTLALLELLFPVGAVYFGTMSTCPLQTLGIGTWQALPQDKVIQIAGTRGAVNTTVNESLPNHTHYGYSPNNDADSSASQGFPYNNNHISYRTTDRGGVMRTTLQMSYASSSNSTYQDNAPVQQDAYLLNGWRRIS